MTDTNRKALSIRLPDAIADELERMAKASGQSMNSTVANLIATAADLPPVAMSTRGDVNREIALDACRLDAKAIGALIGIGRWLYSRGEPLGAAVVWTAAARAVESNPDPELGGAENASDQLARSAVQLAKAKELDMAIQLGRQSIALNSNNRRAANRLGQWLVARGQRETARGMRDEARRDFEEALGLLRDLVDYDSHAELFAGLAGMELAIARADATARTRAADDIVKALRRWSFGARSPEDRTSWLRQVRRLVDYGERESAEKLVDFANANSEWGPIDPAELLDSARPEPQRAEVI